VASTASAAQGHAIDAVCPPELQVKPEMPLKAKDEPGDEWLVGARITIHHDVVTDVKIISGPKVFHDSVRKAIRQYRCKADGAEVVVTQVLRFKLQ
jgi:protein TonB